VSAGFHHGTEVWKVIEVVFDIDTHVMLGRRFGVVQLRIQRCTTNDCEGAHIDYTNLHR